jgi:peptide deformylase
VAEAGARRRILPCWDPSLRMSCRPTSPGDDGIEDLVRDMHRLMNGDRGVGLAAPQVGDDRRVVLIRRPDDPIERSTVMINPELIESSDDRVPFEEGCLSFPGIYRYVMRPRRVRVAYADMAGERRELDDDGFLARVVQHELDHLDGVLFIDHLGAWERWGVQARMALLRAGRFIRGGTT